MKKYDNYKDSGIEWIGEIPEHWEVNKFGRAMFFQEGPGLRNWQFSQNGVKVICVTNIVPPNIDFSKMTKFISIDEYESKYKHFTVIKGDIMLASSGASWGKVAEYTDDEIVILNTSTIRINEGENNKVKKDFIKWIIQSPYINESINILLTGSCQPNFGPTHLNKLICVYPTSIAEQTTIANYLDQKTTKIDQLINQKKRFIELLQEERTAVINQAVTRGLDPKVKMKDSGIEWLGEIPEHWEVKKLKYICDLINIRATEKPDYVLALENITNWTGEIIGNPFENKMEGDATLFETNDILFNKLRPYLAKVVKTDREGGCVGELLVLRAKDNISADYLYHRLSSEMIITIVDNSTYGSKMPRASWDKFISNIYVGIPPTEEQLGIANYVKGKVSEIMLLQEKSQQEIELLKEYKTALISEVVTGKVDVREVVLN
jgi:restriction endonuclease S subunit